MPWSAKAQSLLEQQYAPVAASADMGLVALRDALDQAAGRGIEVGGLLEKTRTRHQRAGRYAEAYRRYVWAVDSADDLRVAPFHVLAAEGRTFLDRAHPWHMETIATLTRGEDPILHRTAWQTVDLGDEKTCADAVRWWEDLTSRGGEGMVVKPETLVARGRRGLVQPAVKCRGKDYLRIIYGPDYDAPEHLSRLRERGLGRKRSLATREFALGAEALERFVAREPLSRVHECVFGVLALETEPVDPRL